MDDASLEHELAMLQAMGQAMRDLTAAGVSAVDALTNFQVRVAALLNNPSPYVIEEEP